MKTLELANLIRSIRKEKLDEQHGGMGKYKGGAADIQDKSGPNKPVNKSETEQHHSIKEEDSVDEQLTRSSFGRKHNPKKNIFFNAKVPSKRRTWQAKGNQARSTQSYVSEEDFEGGKTDTGKPADTVTTKGKTDVKNDKVVADKINTIKENNKRK